MCGVSELAKKKTITTAHGPQRARVSLALAYTHERPTLHKRLYSAASGAGASGSGGATKICETSAQSAEPTCAVGQRGWKPV